MSDVVITPRYNLILNQWQNGSITIRQMELLVKTGWLTREQANLIYTYPRRQTELVLNDPFSVEVVEAYRLEVE